MRIIDLLNKIANGEEVPKKIRIDHWCYKFEWVEHDSNYYDKHEDIDLMSCLSMDKEELNYEVEILEEEKKIPEKLEEFDIQGLEVSGYSMSQAEYLLEDGVKENREMINWILDYLKSKGE
jgi:hypothetical protein